MIVSVRARICRCFFESLLHAYCVLAFWGTEARIVWAYMLWKDWDLVCHSFWLPSSPAPVPLRAEIERMKELRKGKTLLITDLKAALQPPPVWADSNPIISESPAPSIVPGWNRSSKTHILFNESMNDSSNQFNLAYAFLIGVPINYQLPVFTFQCLTIFCWLL